MSASAKSLWIPGSIILTAAAFAVWRLRPGEGAGPGELRRAAALLAEKKAAEAVPVLERLVRRGPPEVQDQAHLLLAASAEAAGKTEQARNLWAEHLRRFPASPGKGEALLGLGGLLFAAGDSGPARETLAAGLRESPASPRAKAAREQLGELNLRAFFAPGSEGGSREYTVASGDTLSAIASRHHTTATLLSTMNGLKSAVIREGQTLRVPARRFEVLVSKSGNTVTLLYGGEFFKIYPAGTGKQNSTPAGTFTIATKLVDPPWYTGEGVIPPDDPRNILGTRWMGFNDPYANYGIHGTVEPDTVGTQSSQGCVRLLNEDVEELYDFLPYSTTVTVIE